MYNLRFDKSNGDVFYFDYDHQIIVDLDPLSDIEVNIATSQGAQQIGTTIDNRMIGGLTRELTGKIIGNANSVKKQMLDIFSPFSEGRLYFNDKYYCDCVIQETPAIGIYKRDCVFNILLYCSYPYWLEDQDIVETMQTYTPCFFFPDPTSGADEEYHGYDQHIFAIKNENTFFTLHNDSEVDTRFSVTFTTDGVISNFGVINVRTLEKIQINTTLYIYEKIRVYWDNGILKVEKTVNGETTDCFSDLDESSDLFWLYQGDNVLQAFAESDQFPIVQIEYNNAYIGVYDGM